MISRTAEYALRAVAFLAAEDGDLQTRGQIAAATIVPHDYLTKVLQALEQAGVVQPRRGPGGGYRLAADSEEISVLQVVEAVSAVPRIKQCPLGIAGHTKLCPLHKKLDAAAEFVERTFRETTIAELVSRRRTRAQCRFPMHAWSHDAPS